MSSNSPDEKTGNTERQAPYNLPSLWTAKYNRKFTQEEEEKLARGEQVIIVDPVTGQEKAYGSKIELDSLDPMQDIVENKNLFFQILLIGAMIKFAKMPGGMRTIQVLGKATIDGLFRTTNSLGRATAGNAIAAWANPVLISAIYERFGLLPPRFNRGYHLALSKLMGIDVATGIIETLLGKSPLEGSFPSHLNLGSEAGTGAEGAMGREVAAAEIAGAAGALPIV